MLGCHMLRFEKLSKESKSYFSDQREKKLFKSTVFVDHVVTESIRPTGDNLS